MNIGIGPIRTPLVIGDCQYSSTHPDDCGPQPHGEDSSSSTKPDPVNPDTPDNGFDIPEEDSDVDVGVIVVILVLVIITMCVLVIYLVRKSKAKKLSGGDQAEYAKLPTDPINGSVADLRDESGATPDRPTIQ